MIEKNTPSSLRHEFTYTTIINKTLDSIDDMAAMGMYTYLSSKPEGWVINKQELMNRFKVGRDFINKRWNYLKACGLLEVKPIRDEKGMIVAWDTILKRLPDIQNTENPLCGDPSRIRVIQNVDNPECGKSAPINNLVLEIKEKIVIKDSVHPPETIPFDNSCNIPQAMIDDWLKVRKANKKPVTQTAWRRLNNELIKIKQEGRDPVSSFEEMVTNGWMSIKAEWGRPKKQAGTLDFHDQSWRKPLEGSLL